MRNMEYFDFTSRQQILRDKHGKPNLQEAVRCYVYVLVEEENGLKANSATQTSDHDFVYKRIHHLAGEKKYGRHVNRLQNSAYGHHSATWASQVFSSAMALPTPTFPASPKKIQSHIESPFLPQAFSYFSSRLWWSTSLKSFRNQSFFFPSNLPNLIDQIHFNISKINLF